MNDMNLLTKYVSKELMYTVNYDPIPIEIGVDFDFGEEKANLDYYNEFANGNLENFIIEKKSMCNCCNQWKMVDVIGGIHASDPNQALDLGIEYLKGGI